VKPCSSYSLPSREVCHPIAKLFDDADNLMSGNDGRQLPIQLSFNDVKIGAAYPASFHAQ
jgi:hypothetical protein